MATRERDVEGAGSAEAIKPPAVGAGLEFKRYFTKDGAHPFDEIEWETRDAVIPNFKEGGNAFEQRDVEFPKSWSQNATNIVAQKYFRGPLGTPQRETSVRQLIGRVVDTVRGWGVKRGYFASERDSQVFADELSHVLVTQKAAFNSPVWFNLGVPGTPQQASACQPYDALVSTPQGLIPIGKLAEDDAIGTKVFDSSGVTQIVATKANGVKEVLRIHTKAGHMLDVTADHLVWRASDTGSGRFVRADDLRPHDKLEWHRRYAYGETELDLDAIAEAALAGWLQGDGFVGQYQGTNRSLTIEAMTVTDAEYAWVTDALDQVLPGVHRLERRQPTQDQSLDCRRIRLYGNVLKDFVERWELRPRGTEMTIPESLFMAPLPIVRAYLRSLFQAEGFVSDRGVSARIGLDMISEHLVRGIQQLLSRFGIFSRVRFKRDKREDRKGCWSLSIGNVGDQAAFSEEIGFVDPRKAEKLQSVLDRTGKGHHDTKRLEIERIEPVGPMEVYDIQTESGEYLSGSLRVHNCYILAVDDTMSSILNWYVEEGMIFKGGSGSGINLSSIRSSKEALGGGGTASGPVSFMRGADASAGTIKCLHHETELVTDHGVVPIRSVQPGWNVLTRFGHETVQAVHDNGRRALLRVRTAMGDEVLCTPEHRFWVRGSDGESWRQAGELRPDDFALVDLGTTGHGSLQPLEGVEIGHHNEIRHSLPTHLDEGFAMWLGWVLGDGSITSNKDAKFVAVQIGDEDEQLIDRYQAITRSVFGPGIHFYADKHRDKLDASSSVRFSSAQVIRFLDANGLRKTGAADLRIPALVQASPAGVRAAFLAGLFEADGHVGNGYPWLSTVSAGLALDVHRLLLSIGVPSVIGRIDDRRAAYGKRPVFTVRVVAGEGVRRFAKLVNFVSDRKSRLLEVAVARKERSSYETQWFLPHVAAELGAVWESTTDQRLRRAIAPYCRYSKPRGMSLLRARALITRFPEELAGTSLARFVEGDDYYVPVTSAPAGEAPTYDLTVADVHEYLVHNLVTHNSGGKTRRAAKMVVLNVDHPDVEDFIWCKSREEQKARALRDAGFDMDLDGKDSASVQYQNANNSVRVTDEFMQAYLDDRDWKLKAVKTGEPVHTLRARDLMRQIAQAAWECADPGMQYDTTTNDWHTCPASGRINASNPCSEYVHLDNSACNLASLNLMKFLDEDGSFDIPAFKHAVEIVFTAQEIIVGDSSYPTEKITHNAKAFRQLGLGYANLGALLMARGLSYDSDAGRAWAGAITAVMTGHAYATSARIAEQMGPFTGYAPNRDAMLRVMRKHRSAADEIDAELVPEGLLSAAKSSWDQAIGLGQEHGYRNAQATVLAPTGCLVGGSLIPTERGLVRLASLGDPAGSQWQDLGIQVGTGEGPRKATSFYVNGLEAVVRVETKRGYRIEGTPRHRIKVVSANGEWIWKRFAEIEEGDRVPLALNQLIGEPQAVPLPPLSEAYWTGEHHARVPRRMTAGLAELIGYFMGDGSLHSRGLRLCVDSKDFDVVERLRMLGKEELGLEAHVAEKKGYTEVAFHSVRVALWWEACGFAKLEPRPGHSGKGWSPRIPDAVLHSNDREVYCAFLRGLFEADGTVTEGYPHWSTTSFDFSRDVQSLLLALGYPATRKIDRTGWGNTKIAVLRLLNLSYNGPWLEEIGFMSDRKNSAVSISRSQQSARHDKIPVTRTLIDRLAPENNRMRKLLLMEHARTRSASRGLATELLELTGDAELRDLMRFFYDQVTSAELGEDELTYDLSVPDNVTYVANGFISHNTISFLMDCDTTGIEPDLALVKTKKLVGGGTMQIVNQTVPRALARLGYDQAQARDIVDFIAEHNSVVAAPHLKEEHYPVFDTSMGDRAIHHMGHIKMMAAAQPFLSGAISKTANVPEDATVEDVEHLFVEGWRLGLKAMAIYRDNSKVAQPLSADKKAKEAVPEQAGSPVRRRLPAIRPAKTFSFSVGDADGYIIAGEYPDDGIGEIFLKVAKQGSTLSGIMDAFAISVSLGLQYGVPLEAYVQKFVNMRFEPSGITGDPDLRFATSLVDYIFRRLAFQYLTPEQRVSLGVHSIEERKQAINGNGHGAAELAEAPPAKNELPVVTEPPAGEQRETKVIDAPLCYQCGSKMQPSGSCYVCGTCGATSGCS